MGYKIKKKKKKKEGWNKCDGPNAHVLFYKEGMKWPICNSSKQADIETKHHKHSIIKQKENKWFAETIFTQSAKIQNSKRMRVRVFCELGNRLWISEGQSWSEQCHEALFDWIWIAIKCKKNTKAIGGSACKNRDRAKGRQWRFSAKIKGNREWERKNRWENSGWISTLSSHTDDRSSSSATRLGKSRNSGGGWQAGGLLGSRL